MDPISAIFTAGEIVNGGKQTKKIVTNEMKAGTNKYTNILNNRIVKAPTSTGEINALNSNPLFRSASDELNFLCKVAEDGGVEPKSNSYNNNRINYSNSRTNYSNNRNNYSNNRNSNSVPRYERPKADLREIRDDRESLELNPYALAGGSVLAAGLVHAIASKDPTAPIKSIGRGVEKFTHKLPRKTLGKNKAIRNILETIDTGTKSVRRKFKKNASEIIDELMEKAAETVQETVVENAPKAGAKIKRMFRDDFVRSGIEAVPYYAAPAALGYVAGKNISDPAEDPGVRRVVVDVPLEELQNKISKQAADMTAEAINAAGLPGGMSWAQWGKEQLPRKAVQGLGRTIFPAIVINATGKNIKGRMEDLKQEQEHNSVGDGTARIILETKNWSEKTASECISELILEKMASNAVKDVEEKLQSVSTEDQAQTKIKKQQSLTNYDDMNQGILKQQRMIKMEG